MINSEEEQTNCLNSKCSENIRLTDFNIERCRNTAQNERCHSSGYHYTFSTTPSSCCTTHQFQVFCTGQQESFSGVLFKYIFILPQSFLNVSHSIIFHTYSVSFVNYFPPISVRNKKPSSWEFSSLALGVSRCSLMFVEIRYPQYNEARRLIVLVVVIVFPFRLYS